MIRENARLIPRPALRLACVAPDSLANSRNRQWRLASVPAGARSADFSLDPDAFSSQEACRYSCGFTFTDRDLRFGLQVWVGASLRLFLEGSENLESWHINRPVSLVLDLRPSSGVTCLGWGCFFSLLSTAACIFRGIRRQRLSDKS